LEYSHPEETLKAAYWKVHVVEHVCDSLQVITSIFEVFEILVLVIIRLIHFLIINELVDFVCSIRDKQQVRDEDVENVGEERLVLQQVIVLVHKDPLEWINLIKLTLSHLLEGLENHAVDYIKDHGYDLDIEDGDLLFSIPMEIVNASHLGLEQFIAVEVFLVICDARPKHFTGKFIVYVIIFIYTSLTVLAQVVVILFGLNVQNRMDIEHNLCKLYHLSYIKRCILTKETLSIEELEYKGRKNEKNTQYM
jgi:hypothetical protein